MSLAGHSQELKAILEAHEEALGGAEAISRLNTLKASGIVLVGNQQASFSLWAAFPNRLRIESLVGDRIFVQSYDGRNPPWQWFPETIFSISEEMEGDEAREFVSDADFHGPLIHHHGKGHTLVYEGVENKDGQEVFKLSVREKSGFSSTILIDTGTYLVVRRSGIRRGGGVEIELDTYYLDYREVEGVLMPRRYEVYRGSTLVRTVLIQTLEGNPAIPAAVFALPDGPNPVESRVEAESAGS